MQIFEAHFSLSDETKERSTFKMNTDLSDRIITPLLKLDLIDLDGCLFFWAKKVHLTEENYEYVGIHWKDWSFLKK